MYTLIVLQLDFFKPLACLTFHMNAHSHCSSFSVRVVLNEANTKAALRPVQIPEDKLWFFQKISFNDRQKAFEYLCKFYSFFCCFMEAKNVPLNISSHSHSLLLYKHLSFCHNSRRRWGWINILVYTDVHRSLRGFVFLISL